MADAVESRRIELGLSPGDFADAAGLTPQGLIPVRNGVRKSYSDKTRMGVARALRWPIDWYEQLSNGMGDGLPTVDHPDHAANGADVGMADLLTEFRQVADRLEARIDLLEQAVREQGTTSREP